MTPAPIRAAFQGETGAFSEQAARQFFGAAATPLPHRTFEDMFAAVATGAADVAVAPIENTLAGSILKNYDLLVEHDLTIVGETVVHVVHNLIGHPGAKLADIRRIFSLPVALAQCERFLDSLHGVEILPAYDTAGSVKMVMESGRREDAAVAGRGAAAAFGAEIIVAGIESSPHNYTRFFVLARPDRAAAIPIPAEAAAQPRKTSIVYRIGHKPGGLYGSLAPFADDGIDLTKIESRPLEGRPWEYSFYLDFVGDRGDARVARALQRLGALADNVRVLGSYARASS